MQRLAESLIVFLLLTVSVAAEAKPLKIGDATVELQPPPGFAICGDDLGEFIKLMSAGVPETNRVVAVIVEDADHQRLTAKESPNLARYLMAQLSVRTERTKVTPAMFAEVKKVIRDQNAKIMAQVKKMLPGISEKIGEAASELLDAKVKASIPDLTTLPPHEDGDRVMSYSAYRKIKAEVEGAEPVSYVEAMTISILHVRNKLLFLYVFGEEQDLSWTRELSSAWTKTILEENAAK